MAWVEDWTIAAGCRGMDPDELFVQGAAQNRAKVVCATCPVRTECLADALDNRVEYGVWGGMTERERRALLRRRPEVRSWRQVLEEARDAYLERTGGVLLVPEAPREHVAVEVAAEVDLVDGFEPQNQVAVGLSA
ncbi:WhiB family transcriptional regulator [Actinospica sp. MGRD01-02]|uniref:Transcriptional regulator WhiB n=1 Tax=Actinospica acidithermotolerans TaxID=2828514 RepID=A0A941EE52_9ACTN|nr:WhiB family transcriptional regulator [Actinospica acidithermotolerans]MBR7826129.1 WhiB family transcriptional regulator [Actinospica acidithermotolerans]